MAAKLFLLALGGFASSAYIDRRTLPNEHTDDCKIQLAGTPIPDENTFSLPLESWRKDRCFPICLDGAVAECTAPVPVCFYFRHQNLVMEFATLPGYTYKEAAVELQPTGGSHGLGKVYSLSEGHCTSSREKITVSCKIPYLDIAGEGVSDSVEPMCPNGSSEGRKLQLQTTATLIDEAGDPHSARNKESCLDWPDCSYMKDVDYWQLSYRCTECPVDDDGSPSTEEPDHAVDSTRVTITTATRVMVQTLTTTYVTTLGSSSTTAVTATFTTTWVGHLPRQ